MVQVSDNKVKMNSPSIAKNSLYLYIRLLVSLVISLYSSRLLLDILGIEDFGIFNVVAGLVSFAMFFKNTLVDASQRFMTLEIGRGNIKGFQNVFCMSINLHLILSIILIIIFGTIGLWFTETQLNYPIEKIVDVRYVYMSSVVNFIVGIMSAPYMAVIIANEKMGAYAGFSVINVVLKLTSILLLVLDITQYSKLVTYSMFIVVLSIIEFIIQYLYVKKKFPEAYYSKCWNRDLFTGIVSFSGWNIIGSGAILLISQGSNILINIFFGPVVNAANGIAFQVMGAVRQFSSSFQSATNPRLIKYYAQRLYDEMLSLCKTASKFSFYLFFIVALPLSLNIQLVLDLWLVEVPSYAPPFCILVLLTALIESMGYPVITVIRATGKLKGYQLWVSAVLLLSLPLSYLLLRLECSVYVVYIVNALLTTIASITRILYLSRCVKMNCCKFIKELYAPVILVTIISVITGYMIFSISIDSILGKLIQIIALEMLVLIAIYTIGLDDVEKKRVKHIANKAINI